MQNVSPIRLLRGLPIYVACGPFSNCLFFQEGKGMGVGWGYIGNLNSSPHTPMSQPADLQLGTLQLSFVFIHGWST